MTTPDTPDRQVELHIRGMHCGGCVAAVERALGRVAGVQSVSVNLATERATIRSDEAGPGLRDALVSAVREAGYDAQPAEPATPPPSGDDADVLRRQGRRLALAATLGAPVVAWHLLTMLAPGALPHVLHASTGFLAIGAVQAVLTFAVVALAGGSMLRGAAVALLRGQANMDLLVSLGTLTALAAGVAGLVTQRHALLLFDAAAMIVLFVAVGKFLEARARRQATASLRRLFERIPRRATRLEPGGGGSDVPVEAIRVGDVLRVPPDAPVPVDGEVVAGHATVDESMLTGESMPVERGPGQAVSGGTRVRAGTIDIRATATGADSAAMRIARMVELAQSTKPPWQRFADRAAAVFVPAVLLIAAATLVGWLWLGRGELGWAIERTIAVLVVACPCALGLAIPTAVVVGTSRAAELGVLVRDAAALEAAGAVDEVLIDKTGTLTLGQPALERVVSLCELSNDDVLRLAASVDQYSEHPLARAIVAGARQRGLSLLEPADLETSAGGGVGATLSTLSTAGAPAAPADTTERVVVGTAAWLAQHGIEVGKSAEQVDALAAEGLSVVCVGAGSRVLGLVGLADPPHPEARDAVARLHGLGVRVRVLSGDRHAAVSRLANDLGIDAFEAQVTPEQKLKRVHERMAAGRRVAMVGDGINDAPALAAAHVGLAIGAGADVARETATICLVGHSPALIPRAIRLSRASARVMRQNLLWAVGYNLVMMPIAIFTPLPPALATAAMMGSSLSVVLNALRLRRLA